MLNPLHEKRHAHWRRRSAQQNSNTGTRQLKADQPHKSRHTASLSPKPMLTVDAALVSVRGSLAVLLQGVGVDLGGVLGVGSSGAELLNGVPGSGATERVR